MKKTKPEQPTINKGYFKVFPTIVLLVSKWHSRLFLIPRVLLKYCFTSLYIFQDPACFPLLAFVKDLKEPLPSWIVVKSLNQV